jgi:hypothetical protein
VNAHSKNTSKFKHKTPAFVPLKFTLGFITPHDSKCESGPESPQLGGFGHAKFNIDYCPAQK